VVAARDGAAGALVVHQDVTLSAGLFAEGERGAYALSPGRHAWLHVARGKLRVNDLLLESGDALEVSDEARLDVTGVHDAEVLLFDLG